MTDTTKPTPGYTAASNGRRLLSFRPPNMGPNSVTQYGLATIVGRSRSGVRNDPWVGTAGDKLVSNMVGTGIQSKMVNGTPELKATDKALWKRFMKSCDADGVLDGYGMQALAVREWDEAGEVFARLRKRRPEDGLPVPLQIQIIEAEQCPADMWETASNGNEIRAGIEFNLIGKRVAYWMYRRHPGDVNVKYADQEKVRIPADEIIHLFEPVRAGQIRGIPRAASTLIRSFNLDQFDDRTLERQSVANLFAGFFTQKNAEGDTLSPVGALAAAQDGTVENGTQVVGLEPGLLQELPAGMEVTFTDPPDAGATYPAYYRQQLLAIAARHGVPYEVLTGDLTGVSDRALKLILNEFRRMLEQRQWLYLIPKWCQPIREAYWDAAVLSGALDAPGYAERRDEYTETTHIPQGWPWSHPVQDVDAERKAVRAGFKSRSSVVSASGEDPDVVNAEIAQDNALSDAKGFVFDSDPRRVTNGGATNQPQQQDQSPQDNQNGQ